MFLRLNVSLDGHEHGDLVDAFAASARSSPGRLGTSAVYRVAGRRVIRAKTSDASAICGTHFGLTNADTSITGQPGVAQAVDELDLVGRRDGGALVLQSVARADLDDGDLLRHDDVPFDSRSSSTVSACTSWPCSAVYRCHDPGPGCTNRQLHLHCLQHDEDVPLSDACPSRHRDAPTRAGIGATIAVTVPPCGPAVIAAAFAVSDMSALKSPRKS